MLSKLLLFPPAIDMTDYNTIFAAVLIFNVLVTFRSSSYWKKYFPGTSSSDALNKGTKSDEEDPTPLMSSTGDVEKGEAAGDSGPKANAASDAAADIRHAHLLRKYLVVYLLAAFSDWLQGPYVYALYDAYGYSQHDIAVLFVAGFGSSMVFGSFVGGMADQGGRKKFVILFAIIYAASCMTKREIRCSATSANAAVSSYRLNRFGKQTLRTSQSSCWGGCWGGLPLHCCSVCSRYDRSNRWLYFRDFTLILIAV